ncbi:MAG: RNA polymerase sigma factor [Planctomyces sp.]|nr:RNA polymerase sigma factor [Planctomyces sp.]
MDSAPETRTSDWVSSALEQFEQRLLRYARRIVGEEDEARDVVQETFLRLCREDPATLNGRLAQWLYTVCRNRAVDIRRQRTQQRAVGGDDPLDGAFRISREPAPSEPAARGDALTVIRRELARLTENQQECIRLKFDDELSYSEISAITGLSSSNVGFLIHTGLKAVRERLRRSQRDEFPDRPPSA